MVTHETMRLCFVHLLHIFAREVMDLVEFLPQFITLMIVQMGTKCSDIK